MTSPGSVTLRGDPPSLVARALHSPRALGAIGVAYAVVPSLAPDAGDGAAWLRVLCATGALLGALPALAIARRLDRANGTACLLVASMAGAVLFLTAVSAALGYPTTAGSVVGPSVLFPAVAYAVATTFLLTVLGATEPERAASPIVAALLLIAFGCRRCSASGWARAGPSSSRRSRSRTGCPRSWTVSRAASQPR
jgi:hypothetical protein